MAVTKRRSLRVTIISHSYASLPVYGLLIGMQHMMMTVRRTDVNRYQLMNMGAAFR